MNIDASSWNEAGAAALLGTNHRPYPDLLASLAALSHTRRVARRPPAPGPLPPPAPAEIGTTASTRIAVFFFVCWEDGIGDEWLAELRRCRLLAPPETLPALLHVLGRDPERERDIRPVLGTRAIWLMRQRPEWSPLRVDEWDLETAEAGVRMDGWRRLRILDAERARAWLEQAWRGETAERRLAYLTAMRPTLKADDEPFLEAARHDRRKEVRAAATELLGRLASPAALPSPDQQASELLARLNQPEVEPLLAAARFPWSAELTRRVLEVLPRLKTLSWFELGRYMEVGLVDAAKERLGANPHAEALLARLSLRAAFHRELAEFCRAKRTEGA